MEANNQQINQNTQEDVGRLRQVRRDKLSELQAAGRDPFQIVKYDQTHHTQDIKDNFETLEFVAPVDADGKPVVVPLSDVPAEKIVSLAGRMMSKRVMGKASFANLQDRDGRMQLYISRNDLGDEAYADFKKMDIGDIIGVKGFAFRTRTGELSVHVKELVLLSKSLISLIETRSIPTPKTLPKCHTPVSNLLCFVWQNYFCPIARTAEITTLPLISETGAPLEQSQTMLLKP